MADLELCAAISDAFGPSGYEKEAVDVIESSLGGLAAHRDSMQNLYVSLPQNVGGRPLVMLDAHTDEVGFMVQSITATGLLRIVPLGGWVEHNIPAHTFLLHNRRGETVRAVSTSKPPHFMTAAERSAPLSMESILLDAGVCSRKDATELLGLEPGLVAVPDVQFSYNDATGLMLGKAFDCRLGCAGVVEVLRALKDETLCADVTAAFSTQEEVGLRGAKITAERLRPALAICLEGTPADDNFTAPDEAQGALKKGVQIRFRDGSMVAHPGLVAFARRDAEQHSPPVRGPHRRRHQRRQHPPCAGRGADAGVGHSRALCAHALRLFCRRRCRRRHCAHLRHPARAYARRAPSAQPHGLMLISNKAQCNE